MTTKGSSLPAAPSCKTVTRHVCVCVCAQRKLKVNYQDQRGRTALMAAAEGGNRYCRYCRDSVGNDVGEAII